MYLPANARTHAAVGYPHNVSCRVEVWQGKDQIGLVKSDQLLGGSVTDQWVSGLRRTVDLTVEPTKEWRDWLKIGVEIRPFRGVRFGPDDVEDCPLGRFPVRKFSQDLSSRNPIPVRAQDRWQRVVANPLPYPVKAYPGLIVDVIAKLIHDIDQSTDPPQILATSLARTKPVLWGKTRVEVIADLLASIGAEAFYDRLGRAVIRNVPRLGSSVGVISAKRGGTIHELTNEVDWENVVNRVGVYSTATDVRLAPVWIGVSDKRSPAHGSNIAGSSRASGWQTATYSSSLFTTREQMLDAANAILLKGAGPARQYSAVVTPHPGYDASDTVSVQTALDSDETELVQISQLTHPLSAADTQQITTMSTLVTSISEL